MLVGRREEELLRFVSADLTEVPAGEQSRGVRAVQGDAAQMGLYPFQVILYLRSQTGGAAAGIPLSAHPYSHQASGTVASPCLRTCRCGCLRQGCSVGWALQALAAVYCSSLPADHFVESENHRMI